MARVLPGTVPHVVAHGQADMRPTFAWIEAHADAFRGQWIAVRLVDPVLVASAPTLTQLWQMASPRSRQQQPPFEELYKQLEEKVALLEHGGLSLDDSLTAYDAFGRVITATDARGSVVSNGYDRIDRLTSVTQQLEAGTGDDIVTSYTYDNFGNSVKTVDPRGNASA